MPTPATLARILPLLSKSVLFAGLPEPEQHRVASILGVRTCEPGELLMTAGEPSENLVILLSGTARVFLNDPVSGAEQHLGEVQEGDTLGEVGLLLGEPRSASVQALSACEVGVLHRNRFNDLLLEMPLISITVAQNLARLLSSRTRGVGLPMVTFGDLQVDPGVLDLFPQRLLLRLQAFPFRKEGKVLHIALVSAHDPQGLASLRELVPGYRIAAYQCSQEDWQRAARLAFRPDRAQRITEGIEIKASEVRLQMMSDEARATPVMGEKVVDLLNSLLAAAVSAGASDLHIEPAEGAVLVRLRVQGSLQQHSQLEAGVGPALSSRIKAAAGLDIADRRRPQDGRLRMRIRDRAFDLRISTLPSLFGEKVVVRLLEPGAGLQDLDQVLVSTSVLGALRQALHQPTGCILVCGPTGSGKTTTLYSALRELIAQRPDLNISTIENPIEYVLPGTIQTAVNEAAGVDFPVVLRALLRQDPDVLMVGEMRDEVTAQIALEASLTGHLVLSTLHTGSALEAPVRLIELGCRPYLVANALSLVLAQRLVRRLCPACRRPATPSDAVRRHLEESEILPWDRSEHLWSAPGCPACKGTGHQGRVALIEALRMSDSLREAVVDGALHSELRKRAEAEGRYVSFRNYGAQLLEEGLTSPVELLRLLGS